MTESKKPWELTKVFDWYFEENDIEVLLPIGKHNVGISIINALSDIHDTLWDGEIDKAIDMTRTLADVILSASMGYASKMLEDLVVGTAMEEFDESINKMLEEDN